MFNKICENCEMNSNYFCSCKKDNVHWAGRCSNWSPNNEAKRSMSEAFQNALENLKENKTINFGVGQESAYDFANKVKLEGLDVDVLIIKNNYTVKLKQK